MGTGSGSLIAIPDAMTQASVYADLASRLDDLVALERRAADTLETIEARHEPKYASLLELLRTDQQLALRKIEEARDRLPVESNRLPHPSDSLVQASQEETPMALAEITSTRLRAYDGVIDSLDRPPKLLREQLDAAKAAATHQLQRLEEQLDEVG